jgi:hypothetical protein
MKLLRLAAGPILALTVLAAAPDEPPASFLIS